jgi:TRAP-type C4-dicarboxylate transport system permease small subunit
VTRSRASDRVLETANKLGRWLENAFLSMLLLGMMLLGTTQIFLRWAGAGSFSWGDEAIRLMVLWIAMIAGIAAAREDRHISIDVLSRALSTKGKALAALVVDLFSMGVCLALAWYSVTMVQFALEDGEVLLGGLPAWWFQSILPVGFGLISWRYLIWVIWRVRGLLRLGRTT